MTYYEFIISRDGGLINIGDYLGVMVAPEKYVDNCPRAWGFVPLEMATPELIQTVVNGIKGKRNKWPANSKNRGGKKRSEEDMLEEVFQSQDYIGN